MQLLIRSGTSRAGSQAGGVRDSKAEIHQAFEKFLRWSLLDAFLDGVAVATFGTTASFVSSM